MADSDTICYQLSAISYPQLATPPMLFGRILGNAVCTIKYPDIAGIKLLTVQPLNKRLEPLGRVQVAADVVHAGPGDLVVMVRAREASLALPDLKFVPVDLACVGVVDELEVREQGFNFEFRPGFTLYT